MLSSTTLSNKTMKNWQTSLYGHIAYVAFTGAGLLLMPKVVTTLLNLGPSEEVWIRVVGAMALLFCLYYYAAIKNDAQWFARISVWGRYFFCTMLVVLALVFEIPMLIGLAAVETGLAAWTHWSLSR